MSKQIVFREVPEEISLSYLVSGCDLRCPGCHSADSWNPKIGKELTLNVLEKDLKRNAGWITCVLFMGGEWHQNELITYLSYIRNLGLKTALYTGQNFVSSALITHLDYLKTGSYRRELGGLDSPRTNQKLIHVPTGKDLNFYFHHKQEDNNDSSQLIST